MQGYDRYAYVNNNPVRYTDPTGHYDDEGCGSGNLCELPNRESRGSDHKKDEDKYGYDEPVLGCSIADYECLIWQQIDKEFNPYLPYLQNNGTFDESALIYNRLAYQAYGIYGYDLELDIAALGVENPLTVQDFANAGVPIEWVELMSPSRRTPGQEFFINAMRLDSARVTNYEPNYLSATMESQPRKLELAKELYYTALMDQYGDPMAAYESLLWSKNLHGPD